MAAPEYNLIKKWTSPSRIKSIVSSSLSPSIWNALMMFSLAAVNIFQQVNLDFLQLLSALGTYMLVLNDRSTSWEINSVILSTDFCRGWWSSVTFDPTRIHRIKVANCIGVLKSLKVSINLHFDWCSSSFRMVLAALKISPKFLPRFNCCIGSMLFYCLTTYSIWLIHKWRLETFSTSSNINCLK